MYSTAAMLSTRAVALAGGGLLYAASAFAQGLAIPTYVVAGGGGTSAATPYSVTGTIGVLDAGGSMSGGSFRLIPGFWAPLTVAFTDEPLTAGVTPIRALHLSELRQRVDAQRARFGLPAGSWATATISPGVTLITAQHVIELRAALVETYQAAGLPSPAFTDAVLTTGSLVKALHISELRAAIRILENQ